MELTALLLGIALLIAGRRLFWLFVAAVGFLYGWSIAPMIWEESQPVMFLLMAVLCALVGAVLVVFFQKLAVGFAGGLMGGYLVWAFVHGTTWEAQHFTEIPFMIGAVIGAILVLVLFDWALTYIAAKVQAGVMAFDEMIDLRDVKMDLSAKDLPTIADEVSRALAGQLPGRVAVVTNSAFIYSLAQAYGELAQSLGTKMGVFYDVESAREWLMAPRQ